MLAGLWLFNGVVVSPLLGSAAIRRLLGRPTKLLAANYLLWTAVLAVTQFLAVALPVIVIRGGRLGGLDFFSWLGGLSIGNATLWAIGGAIGASQRGWTPKKETELLDGRLVLGLGVLWYALAVGFALLCILLIGIAFFYPG
jgi:hypothetical protein